MGFRQDEKAPEDKNSPFDVFTVLGHDLKSPLNAVEAYLEIIRGKVLGDSVDAYLAILGNSIARLHQMRELITDVVDWARIQTPDSPRSLTALDVGKTARGVIERHREAARAAGVSLSEEIEDGLTMQAVPREIELVIGHLVDNAIKYNRAGGAVRLVAGRAGSGIALNVSDTGIGLEPGEQALLFREFTRIKNGRTQDVRGTGLGLAIVKRLVGAYMGRIHVESEPDRGTTFCLFLPGDENPAQETRKDPQQGPL
ncbi:MAG TPA: HAMP domain-containing sensor histidine kinase [Deltaproteobacteria bacterium]|nr:HAMP domain-containing sensor histidine kinase [Deltaproteobacteria bacterium]